VQQELLIPLAAPTLKRRIICMIYEALLLLGVVAFATFLFLFIAQKFATPESTHSSESLLLKLWLFIVIGAYFVFFWCRTGQTLAMKTWRIRLIDNERRRLPLPKAIARYCLAWMWFLPGLAIAAQFGLKPLASLIAVSISYTLWATTALLHKDKQFLHDRLAKTRLVHVDLDQT
jgi:uncharacterized RDD family membrane protein YckC